MTTVRDEQESGARDAATHPHRSSGRGEDVVQPLQDQGRRLNTAQVSGPVVGANSPRRSRVGLRVISGGPCCHFLHDLGVRLNETRGKDSLREVFAVRAAISFTISGCALTKLGAKTRSAKSVPAGNPRCSITA